MISEQKIRDLIALGNENRNLDYKGAFSWAKATNDEKCEIVKDVLAFANARDGGIILVGVNDKTGILEGLTDEEFSSFDQTKFNDFAHRFTDPRHTCDVHRLKTSGKKIVVIEIPEFTDVPILCKQEAHDSRRTNSLILRKAGLYKRTDKATSELIEDADEMRELLNRGLLRRQDELMFAMKQIIQPSEILRSETTSSSYNKEIEGGIQYFEELWGGKLAKPPNWTLLMYPERYIKDRISSLAEIQERIERSAVSLTGWTFPIANRIPGSGWSNFPEGTQSSLHSDKHRSEALRVYRSGLFIWRAPIWEEFHPRFSGKNVLIFKDAIYSITEWMLFAQRYFESFVPMEESIQIGIKLSGTHERILISDDSLVGLFNQYKAGIDFIDIGEVALVSEIRTDALAIARRLIRRLFEMFNWNNPSEEVLQGWQQRLQSGRV